MANSASDARHSEGTIRRKLIESRIVDVMVAVGSNFFYTVTLPVTLWFLDRGKAGTDRADQVLFIDARSIFRQVDRAHRDFADEQIEFLANIVRLYRNEELEFETGTNELFSARFPGRRTPTSTGCAASPRSTRSKRRAGASPPAATSAPRSRISTTRSSRRSSRRRTSSLPRAQPSFDAGVDRVLSQLLQADPNARVPVAQRL